jgi:hypothetical protein
MSPRLAIPCSADLWGLRPRDFSTLASPNPLSWRSRASPFRGGAPDVGLRTCAETSGRRYTHLDDAFGPRRAQGLGICVGYDEIGALGARH